MCDIICNRYGGKGITDQMLSRIQNILIDYGYKVNMNFTKGPKDATNIIKNINKTDLVISIGGDGTFGEVITGNIEREKSLLLAHLPNGTANDIGNIYGMNKSMTQNLKNILDGKVIEIDVPTINNKPFIYVCGFGKFLDIPYLTPQKLKKKLGHSAYFIYGAKDFFNKLKSYDVKCNIDGKIHKGKYTIFIISNSTSVAGFKNFYKHVDLNDGKVEVAMIYAKTRKELLPTLVQLALGGADSVKNSIKYTAKKIEIEFNDDNDKKWDVDGEKLDLNTNKYVIEVKHKINLLVPKNN